MATVVILGGGIGGIVATSRLRRRLDRRHRVVLVDRQARHAFGPSFPWLVVGRRQPAAITRDLSSLARTGIEVVLEKVRAIDPERRRVTTSGGEIAGDYLVLALGAEGWRAGVPGLAEAGHDFYDLDGAVGLRDALARFREGRVAVLVAGLPFRCPAAPYETAMLIEAALRDRRLSDRTRVDVYTPETLPMPVAGPAMGQAVRGLVESRGIGFHPQHRIAAVDPDRRELVFEGGARAGYDLLAVVPPHRCPPVVRDAGLTAETGWVPVDPATLVTGHERVLALGDVTTIRLPVGLPLPKAGVFAHAQAEVVAHNVAAEIAGSGRPRAFDGVGSCMLETGHGSAAYARGRFYAVPAPAMTFRPPSRLWHLGKVYVEQWWLRRWF